MRILRFLWLVSEPVYWLLAYTMGAIAALLLLCAFGIHAVGCWVKDAWERAGDIPRKEIV